MNPTITNESAEAKVLVHPFQTAGLGTAPYAFVTVLSMPSKGLAEANPDGYRNEVAFICRAAAAYGVQLCSCEFCGMCLVHNYIIRDAKGKHFVVGSDCVMKTDDSELITVTENARREMIKKAREAKRIAADEARRASRLAAAMKQREAAGMTLEERKEAADAAALAKMEAATNGLTAELEAVLLTADRGNGNFLPSVLSEMEAGKSLVSFSEKVADILAEVYAKTKSGKTRRHDSWGEAHSEYYRILIAANNVDTAAREAFRRELWLIKDAYWTAKKSGQVSFEIPEAVVPFLTPEAAEAVSGTRPADVSDMATAETNRAACVAAALESARYAVAVSASFYGEASPANAAALAMEAAKVALEISGQGSIPKQKGRFALSLFDLYVLLGGTRESFALHFAEAVKDRAEGAKTTPGKEPVIIALDTPGGQVNGIGDVSKIILADRFRWVIVRNPRPNATQRADNFPGTYYAPSGEWVKGLENAKVFAEFSEMQALSFAFPGRSDMTAYRSAVKNDFIQPFSVEEAKKGEAGLIPRND